MLEALCNFIVGDFRALAMIVDEISSLHSLRAKHNDKEDEAKQLGAERFIVSSAGNPAATLREWNGGADVIVATAPTVESVNTTFGGLAADGTMVVLGVGPGRIEIEPTRW
jgi:D-arabinose 1-dehydrogenase-like Zn-dependent alcohol dehydrogenase